jgi:hypothetical protein
MIAAQPWTYWLSIPILVVTVLNLIGIGAVYYGKVMVPKHEWEDMRGQLAAMRQQLAAVHAATELSRPAPPAPTLDPADALDETAPARNTVPTPRAHRR